VQSPDTLSFPALEDSNGEPILATSTTPYNKPYTRRPHYCPQSSNSKHRTPRSPMLFMLLRMDLSLSLITRRTPPPRTQTSSSPSKIRWPTYTRRWPLNPTQSKQASAASPRAENKLDNILPTSTAQPIQGVSSGAPSGSS
jgi:hypothetical protein